MGERREGPTSAVLQGSRRFWEGGSIPITPLFNFLLSWFW